MQIAIISDTHSYLDERIAHHLQDCDIILHAGDVGDASVLDQLEKLGSTKCVYGNIDGTQIRARCPEFEVFNLMNTTFLMIHIAGAVERYNVKTQNLIRQYSPDVLVCGHSHILKVQTDKKYKLLHVNPGAAGRHGFHKMRTLIKVDVTPSGLKNLQVIELGVRSAKTIN